MSIRPKLNQTHENSTMNIVREALYFPIDKKNMRMFVCLIGAVYRDRIAEELV